MENIHEICYRVESMLLEEIPGLYTIIGVCDVIPGQG